MPLRNYDSFDLTPRYLSDEERKNPYSVIDKLFDFAHLPQIREMLWDWFKVTVTGEFSARSWDSKADLVYFFEKVQLLIEAVYLIHESRLSSST